MNIKAGFFAFGFVCVFALLPAPAKAGDGLMEMFFPWLYEDNTGPDPAQTLQAPFAYDPNKPVQETAVEDRSTGGPMDVAHRGEEQIGKWLMTAVSEIMMFEKPDYKASLREARPYFDAVGYKEYLTFLQSNNILKVLGSEEYYIRSFVQEIPFLLNEGAVDGRFRWLFEVEVMTSYMDRSMKDYKNAAPVNQGVVLKIQVGRSPDAKGEHGVFIESWSGKVEKLDKK